MGGRGHQLQPLEPLTLANRARDCGEFREALRGFMGPCLNFVFADVEGNIASWMVPGKLIKGMGGAMDLVAAAPNIIVMMTHADKYGNSKLLPKCALPLTGAGCIKKVLTDLAYLEIADGAFILKERAPGISVEEIVEKTAGKLIVPDHVPEMQF